MFKNLRQFKIAREQIETIYDAHFSGAVRDIPWRGEDLGDDRRQCALHGAPAEIMQRALAIFEREYGRDHPHAVFYRRELENRPAQ